MRFARYDRSATKPYSSATKCVNFWCLNAQLVNALRGNLAEVGIVAAQASNRAYAARCRRQRWSLRSAIEAFKNRAISLMSYESEFQVHPSVSR